MTSTRTTSTPIAADAGNRLYDTANVSRGELTAQVAQAAAALQDSFNRVAAQHIALGKKEQS